jgi:SPP1 family predicted phage head-tail adaptor
MRAGLLKHTIAIQVQTDVADGIGGFTNTWADVTGMSKVRAAIWALPGAERVDAMKLEFEGPRRIRIRYRTGITTKNRIYWADKAKTFNIKSITNIDERNRMIELFCTEDV